MNRMSVLFAALVAASLVVSSNPTGDAKGRLAGVTAKKSVPPRRTVDLLNDPDRAMQDESGDFLAEFTSKANPKAAVPAKPGDIANSCSRAEMPERGPELVLRHQTAFLLLRHLSSSPLRSMTTLRSLRFSLRRESTSLSRRDNLLLPGFRIDSRGSSSSICGITFPGRSLECLVRARTSSTACELGQ